MLARTEGMEVMEPTKADYEVSAKPPPQPLQPAADGALGCRTDAPFLRVLQALELWVARALALM